MFESLSQRLSSIFSHLRGKGALKEQDVNTALREIRVALLEADVALPAVKAFIESIKQKAVGEKIITSVSPTQMVIKIVYDGLVALLSHPDQALKLRSGEPTLFLMAGLQGSGKTSMSAKIGYFLKKKRTLLVSLDVYRPAAQEQLALLAQSIAIESLPIVHDEKPLDIARRALALKGSYDILIMDTAGRLHIDEGMMEELKQLYHLIQPHETLLVVDALSGQDIITTAEAFSQAIPLTGVCLSRVDSDGRGGAALSLRHCTGCPLKIMGMGESPQQVMIFDATRLADRILDKGDIVGLVEKASQVMSQKEEEQALKRLEKGIFTLDDMGKKIKQINAMGGVKGLLDFLPGMQKMREKIQGKLEGDPLKKQLAILSSMTAKERRMPHLLNGSRKKRIARGSGTEVQEINRLLSQFEQMQKMLKQLKNFKGKG